MHTLQGNKFAARGEELGLSATFESVFGIGNSAVSLLSKTNHLLKMAFVELNDLLGSANVHERFIDPRFLAILPI